METSKSAEPFPVRLLGYLAGRKRVNLYVMALGLLCSLLFCFVIYPSIAGAYDLELDPDNHGGLGQNLMDYHSFSYVPGGEPTVERGPFYPLFIALLLIISHDSWPYSVQIGQCLLFTMMVGLVFWISQTLWSRRVAIVTASVCAVHPLAIWYTSRVWIETMSMFLFTAILAGMVYYHQRPGLWRAVLLGCILAASSLTKSTFLPYAVVVPLLLWGLTAKRPGAKSAVLMFFVAILLVAPWTVRNWRLTGRFIPVHVRMGYNIEIGDELVRRWPSSPLALSEFWYQSIGTYERVQAEIPKDLKKWQKELLTDDLMLKISMERYRRRPAFLMKKIAANAIMFWTLGEVRSKSIAIGAASLSLLFLVVVSSVMLWRRGQIKSLMGAQILLMLLYYAMHLPVEAIARYSVVLLPGMIMYGIGPIMESWLSGRAGRSG